MCGIIGYVGKNNNCVRVLIDGLKNLEYRGYDSSGIACLVNNEIFIRKEMYILTFDSHFTISYCNYYLPPIDISRQC